MIGPEHFTLARPNMVVFERIGTSLRTRLFEWTMAVAMLGMVAILTVSPDSIKMGAFRYLLAVGFTPTLLAFLLAVGGGVRFVGLCANGLAPLWGPRARAVGAIIGTFVFGQMALALLYLTRDTGTLSVGIPVYVALSLGEAISVYRAAYDVRSGH